jgi:hypothetical protein
MVDLTKLLWQLTLVLSEMRNLKGAFYAFR